MAATIFFIFKHRDEYFIVDNTKVDTVPKPREMILRGSNVEQIRKAAAKMKIEITHDTARARTRKHTEEGRKRIAEAKMGDKHPARINGRSQEFRDKVSKTMAGTRRGENNPMYGHKHRDSTRQKMSEKRRARGKYKWICSPDGPTKIPEHEPVPDGYQLGMFYDPYKPDDLQ